MDIAREIVHILENIRQEIYAKIRVTVYTDSSSEYQLCSSIAASYSASTLRLFWLQSQLLNLAGETGWPRVLDRRAVIIYTEHLSKEIWDTMYVLFIYLVSSETLKLDASLKQVLQGAIGSQRAKAIRNRRTDGQEICNWCFAPKNMCIYITHTQTYV